MMLLYQIAITLIPGIGDITAKKLISHCGSAEAVFSEKHSALLRIPGIGDALASSVVRQNVLDLAEKEIQFMDQHQIRALYYEEAAYPERLRQCIDAPVILYTLGTLDFQREYMIAVVGTRKATPYGIEMCRELIQGLASLGPVIISGLAYGIDTAAHKAALDHQLDTIGVLAHGLDRVYPPQNMNLARKMIRNGALVTDFCSGKNPDRENFPKRNRIIAGLSDAVVVVEAADGGGALITADLAMSYNRDVFAIPGRCGDSYSMGCNSLIRNNRAALIQSASDLMEMMNWGEKVKRPTPDQTLLMLHFSREEEVLVKILQENGESGIDLLCLSSGLPLSLVSNVLLQLELRSIVRSLPGQRFALRKV